MDINEACRGLVFRDAEAQKENLQGQIRAVLTYQNGKITKASYEKSGSLIPGELPHKEHDKPGFNRG